MQQSFVKFKPSNKYYRLFSISNDVKENAITTRSIAGDFHFINFIRFVSMIGIVSLHSLVLPANISLNSFLAEKDFSTPYVVFLNFFRFSTISFSIISGYLIAPKLKKEQKNTLFCSRSNNLLKPYLLALLITLIPFFTIPLFQHNSVSTLQILRNVFLGTAFWFIPSHLITFGIFIVLYTKEKLNLLVGIFFLTTISITILFVYSVPTFHTNLIFSVAFLFYYALGVLIRENNWIDKIRKLSLTKVVLVWMISFFLINYETFYLFKHHYPYLLNNFRASNQLYAVVSFLLLAKIADKFSQFSFFNPRYETYGIYLYHTIVGLLLYTVAGRFILKYTNINYSLSIFFTLLHFTICYLATIAIVKFLLKRKLCYLGRN
jgi:hypothetical protein